MYSPHRHPKQWNIPGSWACFSCDLVDPVQISMVDVFLIVLGKSFSNNNNNNKEKKHPQNQGNGSMQSV